MQGWIKLHRKILDNPIVCKDSDHLAVWVYLLLNATHENYPALFKGVRITLEPGQLITGRKSISEKLSISESKTKRILIALESDQQIDRKRSSQNSLITILNWDKYQDCADVEIEEQNTYKIHTQKNKKNDQPVTSQNCYITTHSSESFDNSDQPVTSHRPASDQPVTTNKNVKNVKNVKKDIYAIPYDDIVSQFNSICLSLSKVISITDKRKSKIKARWNELKTIEAFENLFHLAEQSDFLCGRAGTWKCNFDWLMTNDTNYIKVLEGNYNNKAAENQKDTEQQKKQAAERRRIAEEESEALLEKEREEMRNRRAETYSQPINYDFLKSMG